MGGSKLPDLQVLRPKGTSGERQITTQNKETNPVVEHKHERKGEKRIRNQTPEKVRPEKRQREVSPEPRSETTSWMEPPSFLTDEEKKNRDLNRQVDDKQESTHLEMGMEVDYETRSPNSPREPRPREPKTTKNPRELRPR